MSTDRRFGGAGCRRGIRSCGASPSGVAYIGPAYDDAAWTFTRASEAAFVDPREGWAFGATGGAAWLADDVPRVLSDGAVLIEAARTNIVTRSKALNAAGWAGGASVVSDDTTAPDGSLADLMQNTGTTQAATRRYNSGPTSGVSYVGSVYVQKSVGTTQISGQLANGTGSPPVERHTPLDTWSRFVTIPDFSQGFFEIFGQADGQGGTGVDADEHHWWGVQCEAADFVTSPIRTSGATVTRAADVLTLPGGDWDEAINGTGFEIDIWPEFSSTTAPTRSEIVTVDTGTEALYLSGASLSLAGATFTPIALTFSAHQKLTIRVDWAAQELTISGATTGDATGALGSTSWGMTQATDDLYVGRSPTAGRVFTGPISRMRAI